MKEKKKKLVGVYKMFMGDNIYVGGSCNIENRWREHKYTMRGNRHRNANVQKLCDEFGVEAFQFEVIEFCQKRTLRKKEQYWIDKLKPNLNASLIVGKFPPRTPEQLEAISRLAKETLSKKVYQYNFDGELVNEWNSVADAARALDIDGSRISAAALKPGRTACGFMWRYEYKESIEPYTDTFKYKRVNVYHLNGKLVYENKSVIALTKILDIGIPTISVRLKTKTPVGRKYFLCLSDEEFDISQFTKVDVKKFYLYRAGDFEFHDTCTMKQLVNRHGMKKRNIYLHLNSKQDKPYKRFYLRKEYCGEKLTELISE